MWQFRSAALCHSAFAPGGSSLWLYMLNEDVLPKLQREDFQGSSLQPVDAYSHSGSLSEFFQNFTTSSPIFGHIRPHTLVQRSPRSSLTFLVQG